MGTSRATWLSHTVLIGFGTLALYPLLWLVSSSLKPTSEIFSTTALVASVPAWENYVKGWLAMPGLPFGVFVRNSLIVSGLAAVGSIFCSTLVGFAFARIEFRFKWSLFALVLVTMMLPPQAMLVPQYIVFKNIGW